MSVRLILLALLMLVLARAVWRLLGGVVDGVSAGGLRGRAPQRGVQMARDPVCGTFVVPDRAVALAERGGEVYFCSARCRDAYRHKPA
jgi:YHS domain-containing protein